MASNTGRPVVVDLDESMGENVWINWGVTALCINYQTSDVEKRRRAGVVENAKPNW